MVLEAAVYAYWFHCYRSEVKEKIMAAGNDGAKPPLS